MIYGYYYFLVTQLNAYHFLSKDTTTTLYPRKDLVELNCSHRIHWLIWTWWVISNEYVHEYTNTHFLTTTKSTYLLACARTINSFRVRPPCAKFGISDIRRKEIKREVYTDTIDLAISGPILLWEAGSRRSSRTPRSPIQRKMKLSGSKYWPNGRKSWRAFTVFAQCTIDLKNHCNPISTSWST